MGGMGTDGPSKLWFWEPKLSHFQGSQFETLSNNFKHLIFDDIYVIVYRLDLVYEILVTVGIPILDKRVFAKIRYVFWEPAVPRSSIRYLDGWRLDHLENTTFT